MHASQNSGAFFSIFFHGIDRVLHCDQEYITVAFLKNFFWWKSDKIWGSIKSQPFHIWSFLLGVEKFKLSTFERALKTEWISGGITFLDCNSFSQILETRRPEFFFKVYHRLRGRRWSQSFPIFRLGMSIASNLWRDFFTKGFWLLQKLDFSSVGWWCTKINSVLSQYGESDLGVWGFVGKLLSLPFQRCITTISIGGQVCVWCLFKIVLLFPYYGTS